MIFHLRRNSTSGSQGTEWYVGNTGLTRLNLLRRVPHRLFKKKETNESTKIALSYPAYYFFDQTECLKESHTKRLFNIYSLFSHIASLSSIHNYLEYHSRETYYR